MTPCPRGLSSCNSQREFLLMLKALAPGDVVTVTRIDRPRKHYQRRELPFGQCRRGRGRAQVDVDQKQGEAQVMNRQLFFLHRGRTDFKPGSRSALPKSGCGYGAKGFRFGN